MAGRSSGSPAGLRTTSPSSPRIEDLLYINVYSPSPRAQRLSNAPNHPPTRRNLYSPLPLLGHSSASVMHSESGAGSGVSSSRNTPIMSTRRSVSGSVVPRIVRGTLAGRDASASANHGVASTGGRPPPSPSRPRRPSSSAAGSLPSTQRTTSTSSLPSATLVPPPSNVISFPRPSYLEHSALRYCIQSEPSSGEPPGMYHFHSFRAGLAALSPRRSRDVSSPIRDTDSDEDSNASTGGRRQTVSPPRLTTRKPADAFMSLPTRWSDGDRYPSLSVSVDGRDLTFHGANSGGEKEAAAARTNCPIPAACGIYYYEIEILNKGQKGHISIGFGTAAVRLSRLPGWEGQSWGYHGDDGNSFASEREGSSYGPKFTTGDIIGCGIDYSSGQAFFTKNGRYLGPVFENLGSAGDLYPTVGLRTSGEAIKANFGHEPFTFDIDSHVEQMRNRTWARIQSTPVTWSVHGDTGSFVVPRDHGSEAVSKTAVTLHPAESSTELTKPLNELILAYLAHHGYAKTARAFKTQCDRQSGIIPAHNVIRPGEYHAMTMETDGDETTRTVDPLVTSSGSSDVEALANGSGLGGAATALMQSDTLHRQKIVRSIVDGDIDTALDETSKNYPGVLEREGGIILFKLRCRKFVELVLEAAAAWRKANEEAKGNGSISNGTIPDGESMDVDEDSCDNLPVLNGNSTAPVALPSHKLKAKASLSLVTPSKSPSQIALEHALAHGQSLQADYKSDTRPEVQVIYKLTLSLVAFDDPLADDPSVPDAVKEMAGQGARDRLAEDVNRAILESQGRPPHPALERLYRHTQACVLQLGWLGIGAAAFADMPKEFLDA